MLQRVTLVLLVILLATVAWLSLQSVTSQRAAQAEIKALHAEISSLTQAVEKNSDAKSAPPQSFGIMQPLVNPGEFRYLPTALPVGPKRVLKEEATSADEWLARFQEDKARGVKDDERDERAYSLRQNCSEDRAIAVLKEVFPKLDVEQRRIVLDVMVGENAEHLAFAALDLGVADADESIVRKAYQLMREFTLVSFKVDQHAEYLAWRAAHKSLTQHQIVSQTGPILFQKWLDQKGWNESCWVDSPIQQDADGLMKWRVDASYLLEAGAARVIQAWSRDPNPKARVAAAQWMSVVPLDEVTMRMLVMPMLSDPMPRDPMLVPAICEALTARSCRWAWEPLLVELNRTLAGVPPNRKQLESIATALAQADREKTVPTLVAWICHAKSPLVEEVLGKLALSDSANVEFDSAHDSSWWLNWWSINRAQYQTDLTTETGLPHVGS